MTDEDTTCINVALYGYGCVGEVVAMNYLLYVTYLVKMQGHYEYRTSFRNLISALHRLCGDLSTLYVSLSCLPLGTVLRCLILLID